MYFTFYDRMAAESQRLKAQIESLQSQKLLSPYFKKSSQELLDWASSPYDHNTIKQERLIHKTSSGNLVRSKSEAPIDYVLYTNKIPFRYECALQLGTAIIYPDFTIRHPETGEYYYWEHWRKNNFAVP